ncbi:cyanophycin synthetase family protein [Duganella sp. P38]|uniref:cyanophycin synthetase family protein n=1 Tax=Duganella sp. P38 TaxID=3423949 RepID=UPI003D79668F
MKIIKQRLLRGASVHGAQPSLQAILDVQQWHERSSVEFPALQQRLLALMPSLRKQRRGGGRPGGFVERLEQGAHFADIVKHVAMELQHLAGNYVTFSRVSELRGLPGRYCVVCAYASERVASAALAMAVALTDALARAAADDDAGYDYHAELGRLRRLAQRCAVSPAVSALLKTARRRGIPVHRISEDAEEFQLGWGSRQQLMQAGTSAARLDAMLAGGDGRIPVIAITGTNGKTTTTRLIAHAAGQNGVRVGMASSEGVYIGGVLADTGDCTGYHSARMVLGSPQVDFAVLETARGGILRRGLAFDRCDVSVLLNVSEDHLGMDGVETLAELARVKQVVVNAASRAVVLNADDRLCVDIGAQLRGGPELLYFSLDPENPQLLRHLAQGGRAVYLQDNAAVLADGVRHQALLDVRRMPVTLAGAARCHTANVLAAAAALIAAGHTPAQVVAGLSSYVDDSRNEVLRSKLIDVNGVKVIVDYAHNAAAYEALAAMAHAVSDGHVVGVISLPGDRRDADLLKVGAVCAAGFDDLVIYEADNRGRAQGETARLLTCGVRGAAVRRGRLHCKLDAQRAIRFGLGMCKPGDVLVFGCGTSLKDLMTALPPAVPA